jgi:hypothetical protein
LCAAYGVAVLAAIVGIVEYATGWTPFAAWYAAAADVSAESGNLWYRGFDALSAMGRMRGTQGNRIVFASCVVALLPVALSSWREAASPRMPRAAALIAVLAVCVLTDARSGWVGAVAAALTWAALDRTDRRRALTLTAGAIAGALLLVLVVPPLRETALEAAGRVEPALERWRGLASLRALEHDPVFGVGYGLYPAIHEAYVPVETGRPTPENTFVRWCVECGVVGAAVLASLLVGAVRLVLRGTRAEDPQRAALCRAALAGWCGVAVTFLAYDGFYWAGPSVTFWCLLALGVRAADDAVRHA